jgi:Spy/CpxP family protein refolding chaperone
VFSFTSHGRKTRLESITRGSASGFSAKSRRPGDRDRARNRVAGHRRGKTSVVAERLANQSPDYAVPATSLFREIGSRHTVESDAKRAKRAVIHARPLPGASGTKSAPPLLFGGATVRHKSAFVITACLIGVSAIAWTNAQQVQPASASATSMDDVLRAIRAELQNGRADIIAKNVPLTTAQAAQFWPIFERYQKEQDAIMDDQLASVQWFIENFEKADDASALKLINAHFDRDTKMTALRQRWLGEFQTVLGTKLAVRVMQIDRRLSLAHQAYVTSKIPLIY